MDTQDSYVYDYGGVSLYMQPDSLAEGGIELTWRLWSASAYGLGTFVASQHFDKEFSFKILQDWPPGQQVTQRYLGNGAVMRRGPRLKGDVKMGEKGGLSTSVTA